MACSIRGIAIGAPHMLDLCFQLEERLLLSQANSAGSQEFTDHHKLPKAVASVLFGLRLESGSN